MIMTNQYHFFQFIQEIFIANHIDGEAFLLMKEEHLGPNELNFSNLGER